MRVALALGRRGLGNTWPNPSVGCVIVRDGCIVGRGWTQPKGRPHAETEALARAGAQARGATAYVTLEPCAHYGQTPPCAKALIGAGVKRVVAAVADCDTRVAGRGFAMLRAAGVALSIGVMAQQARWDLGGYFSRLERARPQLRLKLATTLDGRIATAARESQWITGPDARRVVHAMRACHDAVMIGSGTARADDPLLTVRGLGVAHQPLRVVLASQLDLPTDSALVRSMDLAPLWIIHHQHAPPAAIKGWTARGARLLACKAQGCGLCLVAALRALADCGVTRLLCEGGSQLAAALLAADVVDEIAMFSAGKVLGAHGLAAVGPMSIPQLAQAPSFERVETHIIGADVLSLWRRSAAAQDKPGANGSPGVPPSLEKSLVSG
ncbi:MAG: bifunctional diaminohydroxyphosphoribosylaminopyrimidine deaminase/5-amino-6-(5-phosphoribosylamino)uracil reductase RibD [Rhodobacteraceae bacterium]|nr:bifunctional diaminohydroxyphosphoribosylaminopyrimidine deaminase/5-amino-6-(5-phosphoribosylamino)uracil reductase RibD [Paracoccaceae bacterium]